MGKMQRKMHPDIRHRAFFEFTRLAQDYIEMSNSIGRDECVYFNESAPHDMNDNNVQYRLLALNCQCHHECYHIK